MFSKQEFLKIGSKNVSWLLQKTDKIIIKSLKEDKLNLRKLTKIYQKVEKSTERYSCYMNKYIQNIITRHVYTDFNDE